MTLQWIDPTALAKNPKNWRRHPASQIAALGEALSKIGWAGACLFNRRTNRLVDGHARVKVAIEQKIAAVPVLVGEWNEKDEAKILITLDPLAAMATVDSDALRQLMAEADLQGEGFADLLDNLNAIAEPDAGGDAASKSAASTGDQFKIVVNCQSEAQQTELLDRFDREGLDCKALVS